MTSPYGGDSSALAGMYDQIGNFNQQELDQRYKISKNEIASRLKIASMQSKDSRYGVDAQRDAEREKLAQIKDEMERIGIPDMLIRKYVAEKTYEIAAAEMSLKRDMFVEETAQAREKLKLDREQMERVGIPEMEIKRYEAEQNARIAQAQQTGYFDGRETLDREKLGEERRQFDVGASGYLPGGPDGRGQATLERERFAADEAERQRRYGLDVGKFGADLASTADTYFQARRFQGVDIPRLMGGAGAATADVAGGPTPGVATMGAYLAGTDPYGQQPALGAPGAAGPSGAALSPEEQARYQQLAVASGRSALSPVDRDELARFQARMGVGATYNDRAGTLGSGGPVAAYGAPSPAGAALSPEEQARWRQLMARNDQIRASGGPGLEGADADEARRFQARGATYAAPTFAGAAPPPGAYGAPAAGDRMLWAGGSPTFNERTGTYGGGDPEQGRGTMFPEGSAVPTASVYGGPAVSASVGPQGYSMPDWYTREQQGASSYPSQDPRQKQVAALAKAMPPSPYGGLSQTDAAALHAMEAIYKQGGQSIAGGEYERLKASGRLGFMQSAGRLLGYDPKELEATYNAYRPAQGSARLAG